MGVLASFPKFSPPIDSVFHEILLRIRLIDNTISINTFMKVNFYRRYTHTQIVKGKLKSNTLRGFGVLTINSLIKYSFNIL